jgi:hypothetical protein
MESSQPVGLSFHVPDDLQAGRYANILGVWHSPHEFTLDFSVSGVSTPPDDPDGQPTIPCEVVARIKVAPTLVFELLKALNENMGRYEAQFGEIRRPGQPEVEE